MAKFSAFGTQFKIGDGGTSETFTTVAGVQDISGPGFTVDTFDVTAHDSPNAFEEVLPGVKRSGDVTFTMAYDPADATHDDSTGLFSFYQDRGVHNFQEVLTDAAATTVDYAGIVTGFEFSKPVSGPLSVNVTIKPTGEPVFT